MVPVKIRNLSNNPLPEYETQGAAGLDLAAHMEGPIVLAPKDRALIPTGLYIELPLGYEGQVRPRSGLAARAGITVLNAPGTIDSDYRGEVKVVLVNLGSEPFTVEPGMRIAQLVVAPVTRIEWLEAEVLGVTARADGGFGHTGVRR